MPTNDTPDGAAGVADETAEIERLRAERDQLQQQVSSLKEKRDGRTRRVLVGLLVVFTCICLVAGVLGTWARRNALDTNRFQDRLEAISQDPAVQEALAFRLTDRVMSLIDPKEFFESVLPERGQFLAAPLTNAVQGFVADRVDRFVASDTFQRLFVALATDAHRAAVRTLREQSTTLVSTAGGKVRINLVPLVDAVLLRITAASPEILGRQVNIPDVTVDQIPDVAIARLEQALGVDLGKDFGQFVVFDSDELAAAQDGLRIADRAVVLFLVLAPVFAALALWLSRRRRHTLLQLCAGIAIGMVLIRRVGFRLEEEIHALPPTARGQRAIDVIAGEFMDPLLTFAAWVLGAIALVALVALVTGPYPWAVRLRDRVSELGRRVVTPATDAAHDERTVAWVHEHRDGLMAGGVLVGLLVLWVADLSWFGLLLVVAIVGAYELIVARLAPVETPAS